MRTERAVRADVVVVVAAGVELALQLADGSCQGLGAQPLLLGLVEPLDLAVGLRVVGPGVDRPDAAGLQGLLQDDAAAAAGQAGEDRAVVAEQRGRIAVLVSGFAEATIDVGALEHDQSGAGWAVAAVVVEDVQDLDVGAVGELPVGGVGGPHLVGLFGLEAQVAALGALVRLRGDEPAGGQDPPDRADRRSRAVALLKVERDGGRAGLMAIAVELFADRDDLLLDRSGGLLRAAAGPS